MKLLFAVLIRLDKLSLQLMNYMKNFNTMVAEEIYAYIERRIQEGVDYLNDEEFRRASEILRGKKRTLSKQKIEDLLSRSE